MKLKVNGHEYDLSFWTVSAVVGRHVATASAVLAVVWFFSEPLLADYVNKKVAEAVDKRFEMIETAISNISDEQQQQTNINARNGVRLENIEKAQGATASDIKLILQRLPRR